MTGWRDDLPPIPSERIRAEAMREGFRRREQRAKRQRAAVYGGAGTAVVALIALIAVQSQGPSEQAGDDAAPAAATTAAAEATVAPATAALTTPETEEAPVTEAPATTFAEAAETTAPNNYTTVSGSIAEQPVSIAVKVAPTVIFEQPAGGAGCGPTTVDVAFLPPGAEPVSPVVHWMVAAARGEAPMDTTNVVARGAIGPFAADTVDDGAQHEVLIYVTDTNARGDEVFRAPLVILRDCSP
jgi:hypothetical protein